MNNLRFLETIRAENGVISHLEYHQRRMEMTLRANNCHLHYDLTTLLSPPQQGLYRCRLLYDEGGTDISYIPYKTRTFTSLQAIEENSIDYRYKYADRHRLDALFAKRKESDDVLIIKNGLITDTTIANIALFDGEQWLTPAEPLLYGTTRQRLIDEGKLLERAIPIEALSHYSKVAVMNAMIGFIEVENGIIFPKEEG
ncbi:MAG: aminotransferase class IV family protein [Campylobacterota bacterium]|nr:aminotransferase class IV family protein [Campylobacterota bacterium]